MPQVVEWLNDRELMRYSENRHHRHTLGSQLDYLHSFDRTHNYYFAFLDDDLLVGTGTIYRDGMSADLGILIGVPGKGYGYQAYKMLADFAFSMGLKQVTGGTSPDHEAMLKIFRKLGFQPCGFVLRRPE